MGIVGRKLERQAFKDALNGGRSLLWQLYGPSGMGKSTLLERFKEECATRGTLCLHLDGELLAALQGTRDALSAAEFWLAVEVVEMQRWLRHPFPRLQLLLARKLPLETPAAVEQALKAAGLPQQALLLLRLLLSGLRWFRGRLAEQAERRLTEALAKELRRGAVVWLVDNHDLASSVLIETRSLSNHPDGTLHWVPPAAAAVQTLSLRHYLERCHRHLWRDPGPLVTVVSGRSPMPPFGQEAAGCLYRSGELHGLSADHIQQAFRYDEDDAFAALESEEETIGERLAERVARLCHGNPLLVELSLRLIQEGLDDGAPPPRLLEEWETLSRRFLRDPQRGLHHYLNDRLLSRVTDLAAVAEAPWRLTLPLRLTDDPALEARLFPAAAGSGRLFPRLVEVGLLLPPQWAGHPYRLHRVTRAVLEATVDGHEAERRSLHQALEAHFRETDPEAAAYHRLAGAERERLTALGVTPEHYWESILGHPGLGAKQRESWRLEPLPDDKGLKRRLAILRQADSLQLGEGMCGDADALLRQELREGGLTGEQLRDPEALQALRDRAPELSDLHCLLGLRLEGEGEQTAALESQREATRVNPAHPRGWYERGRLALASGARGEARDALGRALRLGIGAPFRPWAEGHHHWLHGRPEAAARSLEALRARHPDTPGLALDLARLWLSLHHPARALERLATVPAEGKAARLTALAEGRLETPRKAQAVSTEPVAETAPTSPPPRTATLPSLNALGAAENGEGSNEEPPTVLSKEGREALRRQARADYDRGDYREAERCFYRLLHADPSDAGCWNGLGATLLEMGRHREAESACCESLDIDPLSTNAWIDLGNVLYEQRRHPEAESAYHEALDINPFNASAWNNLGNILSSQGRHRESEAACCEALDINPFNASAWNNLGNILSSQGRHRESEAACCEALDIDPHDANAWGSLGNALNGQGRYHEAEAILREALDINPLSSSTWNNLAGVLVGQGRYHEAEVNHREALDIDPLYANAWHNLALTKQRQGEEQWAQHLLELERAVRAVNQGVADVEQRLLCAREALAFHRRWEAVADLMEGVLTEKPDHPAAHALAAEAALALGEEAAARRHLAWLEGYEGEHPEAARPLALLHLERGDRAAARARLRQHRKAFPPDDYRGWMELAELLRRAGDGGEVEACAVEATRLDPWRWEPRYLSALAAWELRGDLPAAEAPLEEQRERGRWPAPMALLAARLAFVSGDFARCRHELAALESARDLEVLDQEERACLRELQGAAL
ncbi:tetratricopeptide repeat protein [Endothiovibrio diazotrophicus]